MQRFDVSRTASRPTSSFVSKENRIRHHLAFPVEKIC
jgi:hypothetical protein